MQSRGRGLATAGGREQAGKEGFNMKVRNGQQFRYGNEVMRAGGRSVDKEQWAARKGSECNPETRDNRSNGKDIFTSIGSKWWQQQAGKRDSESE